ncbi:hypothetical protein CsSME_00046837 [Camellia sinensis var. sinensis]
MLIILLEVPGTECEGGSGVFQVQTRYVLAFMGLTILWGGPKLISKMNCIHQVVGQAGGAYFAIIRSYFGSCIVTTTLNVIEIED